LLTKFFSGADWAGARDSGPSPHDVVVSEGRAGVVQKGVEADWEEESRRRMQGELFRAEGNAEPGERAKQVGLNPIGKDQHTIMGGGEPSRPMSEKDFAQDERTS
jgi:hypothetical protein